MFSVFFVTVWHVSISWFPSIITSGSTIGTNLLFWLIKAYSANKEEFFSTQVSNIKGGDFDSREIAGLRSYDKMIEEILSKLEEFLISNYVNN